MNQLSRSLWISISGFESRGQPNLFNNLRGFDRFWR
jgi:hypothetical protein